MCRLTRILNSTKAAHQNETICLCLPNCAAGRFSLVDLAPVCEAATLVSGQTQTGTLTAGQTNSYRGSIASCWVNKPTRDGLLTPAAEGVRRDLRFVENLLAPNGSAKPAHSIVARLDALKLCADLVLRYLIRFPKLFIRPRGEPGKAPRRRR